MMKHSKVITLLGLAAAVSITGNSIASSYGDDDSMRELKREHKSERREMRRAHRAESMLLKVDVNKDGQIDIDEYLAHAQERFNKLDIDANGFVTTEEAQEAMQKMRQEHKEKRRQMREKREAESS